MKALLLSSFKILTTVFCIIQFTPTALSQRSNQEGNDAKNDVQISIVETDPITYIGMEAEVDASNKDAIAETMGKLYGQLTEYLETSGTASIGNPIAVYRSLGDREIELICGLPVDDGYVIHHETIKVGKTLGGKAVKATHKGNYDKLPFAHEKVNEFIDSNNLMVVGYPYEIYITNPDEEPDSSQWVTEIYYPLGR